MAYGHCARYPRTKTSIPAAIPHLRLAGMGDEVDKRKPQGQYRTVPDGDHAPMVYVWGSGAAIYVTEATYRAKGFLPLFEKLPTEDEYDASRS